jgi:tetratricopeptide (TPR) repeat protein
MSMRHPELVRAASFSPDGRRLMTTCQDGVVRFWDVHTGSSTGEELRSDSKIDLAAFSDDGRYILISVQDKTVRLVEAATLHPVGQPMAHDSGVRAVAFSHDSRRLVTATAYGTISIWDVAAQQVVGKPILYGDAGEIRSIAFSPDDRSILTAASDFTARQWDVSTLRPVGEVMRHGAPVTVAAYSPDGKRIVTVANDQFTVRLWEAQSGLPVSESLYEGKGITSVAFSSDNRRLFTTRITGTIRVWDVPHFQEAPPWLAEVCVSVAGLEPVENSRSFRGLPGQFVKIREVLTQEKPLSSETADATRFRRWFFSNYLDRSVSPWSNQTVSEYLEQLIRSHNTDDLDTALGISPGNPMFLAIAGERSKDKQLRSFYCRFAGDLSKRQADPSTKAEVLYHLALAQRENADSDEAKRTLAEAIQIQPKRSDFLVTRAEWLLEEGKSEEALIVCDQAVQVDPSNPISLYERAWQYAKSGAKVAAVNDFQAASEQEAVHQKSKTIEPAMRERNGWALLELGKPDLAMKQFLAAVRTINVSERGPLLGLAIAYWNNGQRNDAIRVYLELCVNFPELARGEAIGQLDLSAANQAVLEQVRLAATAAK